MNAVILSSLYVALLLWAAISDLTTYRIPNVAIITLVALFCGSVILLGAPTDWLEHILAALLSLTVGWGFYALRQMGAGDVKLIAAISLWAGLAGLLPFLVFVGFAGLGLMLILLAMRQVPLVAARLGRSMRTETFPRVMRKGEGVPYAVAIVAGAAASLPWYGPWLWH